MFSISLNGKSLKLSEDKFFIRVIMKKQKWKGQLNWRVFFSFFLMWAKHN